MNWRFWLSNKQKLPEKDVLTEMAELMQTCQLEGAKPMLFVLTSDSLEELKQRNLKFKSGIFGADYFERLTTIKSIFGVPICFDSELTGHVMLWSIKQDKLLRFGGGEMSE